KTAEDQRGDHRPLADGGGDAFGGSLANIAGREKADSARLSRGGVRHAGGEKPDWARRERERITLERPAVRRFPVRQQVLAGEDVAPVIRKDVLSRAPLGVRRPADA